ncbi:hypothetical protein F4859DRAFT_519415 [Xylaria cf. heliscus]|nr:hypothetical protein F4859DRAFT_519415 [Xylaria cf. heliscus]
MLKTTLITYLASVVTTTSTPGIWCLTPRDGAKLASRYADLIGAFAADKACSVLTLDFAETSDSVNTVLGIPAGNVTYDGRDAFIAAQHCWPAVAMDIVAVDAVTCDTVVLRWTQRWTDTSITGISVLVAVAEDDDWRIRRVWEEFNGLAVLRSIQEVVGIWVCNAR